MCGKRKRTHSTLSIEKRRLNQKHVLEGSRIKEDLEHVSSVPGMNPES